MTFELRMAWREMRPSIKKLVFMVSAIALGVGALTGIKGFSRALNQAMLRSARDLIAADLAVRMNSSPNKEELGTLQSIEQRGALMTRVTETLSMASPASTSKPILCSIKAVDPSRYPFYGTIQLDPGLPLRQALADDSAVVSQDFLIRTGISRDNEIQIGGSRFHIAAILKEEPDRLASGIEMGPRILITRRGLEQSGLIQFGSRAAESYLYKLPPRGLSLEEAKAIVTQGFRRPVRISDYRNPNPSLSRGLDQMTNYLSLVGLLALLVGGLGVATTIHTYLQQKLDSIAIIKCLGGRAGQIMRIYLIQGILLGTLGSLIGVGLGYLVQLLFPRLLVGLINLPTQLEIAPGAAIQGFLIGLLVTTLFLLPPLLAIGKVRPARVFLREMPETHYSLLRRLQQDPLPLTLSIMLLLGVGLLASWLAESLLRGFGFIAGLAGAILILALGARLLMVGLKHVPRPSSLALRHGLTNLNRPGNHVASILVALGIGVAFILTVYFIQTSLLAQIVRSAPANFPNVFLLGITERDRLPLWSFLQDQRGAVDAGAPIPNISSRLERVDGKTMEQIELDSHDRRHYRGEFSLTWTTDIPPDTKIVEGQWWKPPYNTPLVSVGQEVARSLKIGIGSVLEFNCSGTIVRGRVVNIREVEFSRPGSGNQFILSPGALDNLPASYVGALRIDPSQIPRIQSELFSRFPSITSIDVGQMLTRIQGLMDKIAAIIRFIALFAILSGIIIMASSVASTRYQRIREAVLLKTLGATRSQVARIQAAEFLIVGLAAGLIGGLLAAATARYLLGNLLNTEFDFRWLPLLVGTGATAVLAIVTGWIANRGVLNHKPLEILREN
jgi:putative ABC transport system permease protein